MEGGPNTLLFLNVVKHKKMAKNVNQYATFVALDPIIKNSVSAFGSFRDDDGNLRYISYIKDRDTKEDVPYKFKFNRDKRFFTVPVNKTDQNGENVVQFLRDHPLNATSPNAVGNPWFKELDNARDANVAIDSFKVRNEAENKAFGLKGAELLEVASSLGFSGDSDEIIFHKVLQFASKNPSEFLDSVADPNRGARAIFEDATKKKVITKHGFRIVYQDIHLGNSKDLAIAKIAEDKELQEVLKAAIKKAG